MKKNKKTLPEFRTEEEERKFWETHDFTDYLESFQPVNLDLSELRPSTKSVTIRLPESLLSALKKLAHEKDIPYQSLMKIFLAERVKKEYKTD
ncbi:MAG TPA: BrnA antitoxin family protein [Candidatus Woesebacteria bacterium]|nr:BrnA antitoxin family protein [Candidatus Woesebacteria bacterium]